jgi:hypothetical protein
MYIIRHQTGRSGAIHTLIDRSTVLGLWPSQQQKVRLWNRQLAQGGASAKT